MSNTGYENAPQTLLLATNCAACNRPLCDSVSVNAGIGPECRKKYGYNDDATPEARAEANQIVWSIAVAGSTVSSVEAACRLAELGFGKLARKIIERTADIVIELSSCGTLYMVTTPYNEAATSDFRNIPGRRWLKALKENHIPVTSRRQLWNALCAHFTGMIGCGPSGAFVVQAVR